VAAAPLVIVTCGVRWIVTRARREQPFVMLDVPIAMTQILLQATELGLGCSWTLDCDEDLLRRLLGIPDDVRVVAVLGLGWPGCCPSAR
jgi:nitroreductase